MKSQTKNKQYKVYVAGPMSGYKMFNFPVFDKISRALRKEHPYWVVISPADMDRMFDGFDGDVKHVPATLTHRSAMARDLPVVIDADAIYLLPGWSKSKGAKAELATALACGLDIMYSNNAERMDGVTLV